MKILRLILFVLFGLLFINAGLDKFLHYMPIPPLEPEVVKVGEAFLSIKWLLPLVGAVELIAGLLFLFSKTRLIGAMMIFPVMIGILLHNAVYMPSGLLIAGVLFGINLWVLYVNKGRIKELVL
jgi:putative oxidoreductase